MALKWLRDNLRHLKFILWGVVAVFILLVFVDWGAGRAGRGGGGNAAVRIGSRVVSESEFVDHLGLEFSPLGGPALALGGGSGGVGAHRCDLAGTNAIN